MDDIFGILKINKELLNGFHLQADRLVDHQTDLAINRDMRRLKEIEDKAMTGTSIKVSKLVIDEVIKKVISCAKNNNQKDVNWSIRELRIVSYYLIKLQDNNRAYEYAINLLKSKWKDLFFNGLSFYCLDSWTLIDPQLRIKTCELLRSMLEKYSGTNRKYIAMKNHANLFDEAGATRLSALLSRKKQDLQEAPSYFCNKPSTLGQSFYSDVIVNFFESNNVVNFQCIEEIFEIHNNERTKKLVLADLVLRIDRSGNEMKRTQLCKFANRILGDITLGTTWAPFSGATEKEAQKLKKAKQLINLWLNKKIIETFFEICAQDRERKMFWLKYLDSNPLDGFQIVGSTITKKLLQADSRVSGMFHRYFTETDSYSAQTSALVLFIKNKMLVEFSDTGALYVYNQNHRKVNLVTKKKQLISSTADLKVTSMDNLIEISAGHFNEEGRMRHAGDWQYRLNRWFHKMVLTSENRSQSVFVNKDDELFHAKPIKKNEAKETSEIVQNKSVEIKKPVSSTVTSTSSSAYTSSKAVHETTNLRFEISSKWFFNDKCRVVASLNGFYVHTRRSQRFTLIQWIKGRQIQGTNIWIKRPNAQGWVHIVHSSFGVESTIGFMKEIPGGFQFKRDLAVTDFIKINTH